MIVYQNKGYETRSDKPAEDWTGKALYVVEDGTPLAAKIREHCPYYDFVEENGVLVDVTPTQRPEEPEPLPSTEERLEAVEEVLADLIGGML
ncbi:MAG: hypothetical protein ACOX7F_07875 [Eubacteriales bacterium]|jgi:hypothetical protein